ncbi:MBL fold metallo-hydrolase [Nocardia beijingensis]|uniref:MBL fold metallo-hydrolase n=1 Tax=Nocardia beijingensis TaxID=95162 RepID=UPI0033B2F5B8
MTTADVEKSLHGEKAQYHGGLHRVARDCYAYLQPNGGLGESNVGLVVGGGSTVVIDTCWDHDQARRMLDAAAPVLAANPITTVINTHSNGDHWWGNAVMPADVEIITSRDSRNAMDRENRVAVASLTTALKIGAKLPLPGSLRQVISVAREEFGPFNFWGVTVRYPTKTFTGSTEVPIGDRVLDLVQVGPAHTPGDLMVFDRDRKVVFAGDILFIGPTPIMWDGPARNWIKALEMIAEFKPAAIVPGHGPLATLDDIADQHAYFVWLQATATAMCRAGVDPVDAAVRMLTSDTFLSNRWSSWDRPESILAGIKATYRDVAGAKPGLNQFQMLGTMRGTQTVAARLRREGLQP